MCVRLSLQPVKTRDTDEKRTHILEELCATEKSFVRVLELICKNFYLALKDVISQEDCRLLFDTAQVGGRGMGEGRV